MGPFLGRGHRWLWVGSGLNGVSQRDASEESDRKMFLYLSIRNDLQEDEILCQPLANLGYPVRQVQKVSLSSIVWL